jgi:hypothetical protein
MQTPSFESKVAHAVSAFAGHAKNPATDITDAQTVLELILTPFIVSKPHKRYHNHFFFQPKSSHFFEAMWGQTLQGKIKDEKASVIGCRM